MKITHNKVGQNLNLKDTGRADKATGANGAAQAADLGKASDKAQAAAVSSDSAKVDVSPRAQEMKRIKDIANQAPDVDMEKVEKFRRMIDEGNYKVDAKAVASKMIDEELALAGAKEASE